MRITGSTADAVIQSLYPETSELLKRFEMVKKVANVADGERDRLRKYIQEHVPEGRYNNILLSITEGAEQVYPNADGKFALKNYCIIEGPAQEAGIEVIVIASDSPNQFVHDLLQALQKGKDYLVDFVKEHTLITGLTLDNAVFYTEKGSLKLTITEIPNDTTRTD